MNVITVLAALSVAVFVVFFIAAIFSTNSSRSKEHRDEKRKEKILADYQQYLENMSNEKFATYYYSKKREQCDSEKYKILVAEFERRGL